MSHKVRKDAVSTANKKLDSRLRRLLREAKRNPVAEEMHKYHKPKTHKQRKRSFKDYGVASEEMDQEIESFLNPEKPDHDEDNCPHCLNDKQRWGWDNEDFEWGGK